MSNPDVIEMIKEQLRTRGYGGLHRRRASEPCRDPAADRKPCGDQMNRTEAAIRLAATALVVFGNALLAEYAESPMWLCILYGAVVGHISARNIMQWR